MCGHSNTLLRLSHSDYKIKRTFGGVFASDMLPEKRGHYRSFIVNTDSSMSTGQHWQAMYFDNNQTCISFCSYGTYPIGKIKKFIDQNSARLEWNFKVLQHPRTMSCGLFCLYFLWHVHRGLPIFKLTETKVCENE
ncbi:uncharacterized protein TNIN_203051 [Trichonephila inaurata madagascariensis]|uniref:Uncharacterized protein n=1 Tax=Trichonephila inaurata madagascariensis TaxID=2747483 RepID=A0A8X7C2L7_9ARAC|nr:uncharacterized protein TNIN_203051 [Trichonephila inaurata madagascariensis]